MLEGEEYMRTIYKISLLALALVFIVGATGCAPKQAAAGPVTIHILTMDQAGLKPAEIDQIARDFEAKNPDIKVNMEYLGYDFNTVELAVRDGVPYAIDFCNPAPDADLASVGDENFDWVVETAATYAIERAIAQQPGRDNLTWGAYIKHSALKKSLV